MSKTDQRVRILYVENGIGYGGAVICLRNLASNLTHEKYDCCVVSGRSGPEYEEMSKEIRWRYIRDRYVDVVSLRRRLNESTLINNAPVFRWILSQLLARLDDLANFLPFFLTLLHEILIFRPHIIHANNEPLCNRAAIILGYLLRIPVICHVRGPQNGSWMMRPLYSLPDHFITISRWIDQELERIGVPSSKRTVLYDGIEVQKLAPGTDGSTFRNSYALGDNVFAVGLVGLLIPWKGQDLFLDAAERLNHKIENLRMLLVGGTPVDFVAYEKELREKVHSRGLDDTVLFTGHVANMPAVYSGLDVVVSASIKPEPLGIVGIEAMLMGRPLIATNHGGCAEINTNGETALLFDPTSVENLCDGIESLYRSKELRSRLGTAARARALQKFYDIHTHAKKVEDVYARLLKAYTH